MFSIQSFLICQSKLPMNYKHLNKVERFQIYALMKAGHDQTQIAILLDRNKSTITGLVLHSLNHPYIETPYADWEKDKLYSSNNFLML